MSTGAVGSSQTTVFLYFQSSLNKGVNADADKMHLRIVFSLNYVEKIYSLVKAAFSNHLII